MIDYCSNCDEEFEEDDYRYCPYCGEKLTEKENREKKMSSCRHFVVYSNGCGFVIDLKTHWVLKTYFEYGIYSRYSDLSECIWLDKIDYSFNDAVDYLNKNWYKIGV